MYKQTYISVYVRDMQGHTKSFRHIMELRAQMKDKFGSDAGKAGRWTQLTCLLTVRQSLRSKARLL
jgi:hypothetical protein